MYNARLGDIYNFQYGTGNNNPDNGGVYPVYGSNGIIGGYHKYNSEDAPVIGHIGANCGSVVWGKGKHYVTYNGVICNIKEGNDAKFGYYSLLVSNLKARSVGSAQPFVSYNLLNRVSIYLPPLPIQQKIASILSTYDTLIENNTKRIRLLEQMAENLYKEWFVRFRFPGHENVEMEKSKYGKVPSGFKLIKMQDAFEYYVGGGWGEEEYSDDFIEEANVIRGADFPKVWQYDISSCPRRFHKKSNYKARQLKDGDIVMEISGGTSEQPVGRAVLVTQDLIDRYNDGRVICASFCKLIRLNKNIVSPYYFYYWMKFLYDTRIIDRFQLQSTGIINFKFEPFLRKGDVMLPTKDVMNAFEKQVKTIHSEMNKLAQHNMLLAKQRDLLLPRLMSGKLEVIVR